MIHILTNVPCQVVAPQVAELYRKRWTLETAFKHLEAYCHSEINTLGYPKAALFGFCLAPGGLQFTGGGVGRVAPRAWRRDGG